METKREHNLYEVVESEIVISRVFNAPRELIWRAFTDPEMLKAWWGPKGFTAPFGKIDLKLGGEYLFCMRSPEGKDFWSKGTYLELVKPEKIVMTDSFSDENGNIVPATHYGMNSEMPLELLVTITLEDIDGKTRFVLRHNGIPEGEIAEQTEAGWNESLDKLAEVVNQHQNINPSATSKQVSVKVDVNPYLYFPGNAEEAFSFYKSVFGGEYMMVMRFKDTPDGEKTPPHLQNKIMHIALPIGKSTILMASDSVEQMGGQKLAMGNNFYLTIGTSSKDEADMLFNKLSQGGTIEMAMNNTFWGSYFGMLRDKFGTQWMITYDNQ